MRSTTLFALVLLGLTLLSGCKKHWEDDQLSIARESYSGDQLRIDGYYVKGNTILSIYVLYDNGILLVGDSFYADELESRAAKMQTTEWQAVTKKCKYCWGAFTIRGNEITYERWVPPSGGGFPTFTWKGTITSDTEFVMTSRRDNRKGKTEAINEVYRFVEFEPKPDSTNPFVN
ncbi:hypothetical protein [Parapedobacter tibetensis]|uniref:hypothetical protein n=1 Tax=Parapedobacter tibetensis TaxID=2972951 RepID=UPI00214DBE5C|nr:hypothetical protein [Parapedobacter tibetensis]